MLANECVQGSVSGQNPEDYIFRLRECADSSQASGGKRVCSRMVSCVLEVLRRSRSRLSEATLLTPNAKARQAAGAPRITCERVHKEGISVAGLAEIGPDPAKK
jgi:hypothetical protein